VTEPGARRPLTGVGAITLVVEDLAAARDFYDRVFGAPVVFEDESSFVVDLGTLVVNLLAASAAVELVAPGTVGAPGGGFRSQLTIWVPDVDAVWADLRARGVELLNGPIDRPWGQRTIAFADPAGHLWEIAQELPESAAAG
jgi:lactoylglutathione lyase